MTIKAGKPIIRTGLVAAIAAPITVTGIPPGPKVWFGEGAPPPESSIGISVGDTYVDNISGQVYRLDPGE